MENMPDFIASWIEFTGHDPEKVTQWTMDWQEDRDPPFELRVKFRHKPDQIELEIELTR